MPHRTLCLKDFDLDDDTSLGMMVDTDNSSYVGNPLPFLEGWWRQPQLSASRPPRHK